METAVSQQQNAVARFLFGLYFAVCNMTVKEEQTMKKMILMTANGMNLFEKDLEMLVQERDYRTIGQRLTEMEPQQASRWLARQDEQLRFAVACKMEPDKAEQICACTEQESRTGYLSSSAAALAKSRIFWLMALMISGMITGGILARYESAFAAVPMLVTFIPMLTDTGGNAGSQSSTIIIRAMTMGEIGFRNLIQVLWKEIRVGVLAGAALSAVNFFRLMLTIPHSAGIALTVSLAMLLTVVMAKAVGAMLPLLAGVLHWDPAIMAAPLITTIVDAFALIMYFKIAQVILGL